MRRGVAISRAVGDLRASVARPGGRRRCQVPISVKCPSCRFGTNRSTVGASVRSAIGGGLWTARHDPVAVVRDPYLTPGSSEQRAAP
jgi:hypothetical protein